MVAELNCLDMLVDSDDPIQASLSLLAWLGKQDIAALEMDAMSGYASLFFLFRSLLFLLIDVCRVRPSHS